MSNSNLIMILEDSFKNGMIAKGYLEVVRSIQQRRAKLVVVGEDVDNKEMIQEIRRLCNIYEIPFVKKLDKSQLGNIVGLNISTGFLSIKVSGFNKTKFDNYISHVAKAKSQ